MSSQATPARITQLPPRSLCWGGEWLGSSFAAGVHTASEEQTTDQVQPAGGSARVRPRPARPNTLDLANRLKSVVTELETGVPAEPGDLMTPSEKLRAIADLIDRRAATAAPPTER